MLDVLVSAYVMSSRDKLICFGFCQRMALKAMVGIALKPKIGQRLFNQGHSLSHIVEAVSTTAHVRLLWHFDLTVQRQLFPH